MCLFWDGESINLPFVEEAKIKLIANPASIR